MNNFTFNYEIDQNEYGFFMKLFNEKFGEGEFERLFEGVRGEFYKIIEDNRDFYIDFLMNKDIHGGYISFIERYYKDQDFEIKSISNDIEKLKKYFDNLKAFLNKFKSTSKDEINNFLEEFIKKCVTKQKSLYIVRNFYNAYLLNQVVEDKIKHFDEFI